MEHVLFDTGDYWDVEEDFIFEDAIDEVKSFISDNSKAGNGRKLTHYVAVGIENNRYGTQLFNHNGEEISLIAGSLNELIGKLNEFRVIFNDETNMVTYQHYNHDFSVNLKLYPITKNNYDNLVLAIEERDKSKYDKLLGDIKLSNTKLSRLPVAWNDENGGTNYSFY